MTTILQIYPNRINQAFVETPLARWMNDPTRLALLYLLQSCDDCAQIYNSTSIYPLSPARSFESIMMFFAGEGWGEGMEKIYAKTTNSRFKEKQYCAERRANRLGFKFKRQVPIGKYIVDLWLIKVIMNATLRLVVHSQTSLINNYP